MKVEAEGLPHKAHLVKLIAESNSYSGRGGKDIMLANS